MAMNVTRIYALIDPRDERIRYVGRTSQSLRKRLHGHSFKRRETSHTRRDRWVQLLKSLDMKPIIQCLAVVCDDGFEAERWWIAKFTKMGFDLVNANEGGPGCIPGVKQSKPKVISPETREKIRASLKGRIIGFAIHPENMYHITKTEDSERRRTARLRGHHVSGEQREKARRSNVETWKNPELRRQAAERTAIQIQSTDWSDKYRKAQTEAWAKLTPEQRAHRCQLIRDGKARRKLREVECSNP